MDAPWFLMAVPGGIYIDDVRAPQQLGVQVTVARAMRAKHSHSNWDTDETWVPGTGEGVAVCELSMVCQTGAVSVGVGK
jgi:hypothetical protein